MIRKLQRKFVFIAMGSPILVLTVILGAISGVNFYTMNRETEGLLMLLADNEGRFPEFKPGKPPRHERPFAFEMTEETRFETRYFLIWINQADQVIQIDTSHIAAVSSNDAENFAYQVLNDNSSRGYLGYYKYWLAEKEYGKLIVFLDCHSKLDTFFSFLLLSLGIGVLCVLVVFFLVSVLSKRAIKPIVQNMENQKRFITDAGHEIKTPLSIISANADVLELTGGKNEWVDSIRNQTMRLNGLVQDLLTLSQMEEDQSEYAFSPVSLSDMVEAVAASFRTVAFSRQISFSVSVEKDIVIDAQENSIRKLLSVLIDNAVKYAGSSGWVVIRLWAEEKVVHLDILNSCENVEKLDFQKLFDRFYCADQSRSRVTGGYGIGLSIAKAIVEIHKAKIAIRQEGEKGICFSVLFPIKEKNSEKKKQLG